MADRNLPPTEELTRCDWETAEYVYRFLFPGSDGDPCHPDVAMAARIVAKIRKRHDR